ncbi:4133_t:CDS:2 [Acaulospora morrowiae]|uniref:4133_t:CDS:1 n=1 Tax=Acaulospora morrowiae TaxID=94023 RepID=A0A9N8ZNJ9_9GLOM|nr:4133_t:CDS:2 [Acaulospora morrowiae]
MLFSPLASPNFVSDFHVESDLKTRGMSSLTKIETTTYGVYIVWTIIGWTPNQKFAHEAGIGVLVESFYKVVNRKE